MNPLPSAYSAWTPTARDHSTTPTPGREGRPWSRIPSDPAGEDAMDFALTEQQELIRKEVATLARSFPPDYWLEKDRSGEYPWEFVKAFGAGGGRRNGVPREERGSGARGPPAAVRLLASRSRGAGSARAPATPASRLAPHP